jgi:hypothetical protein
MVALTPQIQRKIEVIVGDTFVVDAVGINAVLFKNRKLRAHNFYLYCSPLAESEILEVAGILKEVFSETLPNLRYRGKERPLNRGSEESRQLVKAIIDLEASALHKLLLLTSGSHIASRMESDLLITLAQSKSEFHSDPAIMTRETILVTDLQSLYILPGVSIDSLLGGNTSVRAARALNSDSLDNVSKLMAFIASNSEKMTLDEHSKLRFGEAIRCQKSIENFEKFNQFQGVLKSRYRKLAGSMTASELHALSLILYGDSCDGVFPEDMLRHRSIARSKNVSDFSGNGRSMILRYMSPDEKANLDANSRVDELEDFLKNPYSDVKTPKVVYAAIAEVFAEKGEKKAFEVMRELKHLKMLQNSSLEIYEATVALISEALKPESDDFPFSWIANLSEHSWVLSSHLPKKIEYAEAL